MAGKIYTGGTKIFTYGQPVTALLLIAEGKVRESYPGGSIMLSKGDVIGICEICSEFHFLEYEAAEDTTILSYPIANVEALEMLLQSHSNLAAIVLMSSFRQIGLLLNACSLSQLKCSDLYKHLPADYDSYSKLCGRYRMKPLCAEGLEDFSAYYGDEAADMWLSEFYAGFLRLYSNASGSAMLREISVSLGLLRKCSLDFRKTYLTLSEQYEYLKKLGHFYFNEAGDDIFGFYTLLLQNIEAGSSDYQAVCDTMRRIVSDFSAYADCTPEALEMRLDSFNTRAEAPDAEPDANDNELLPDELIDSLGTILAYSECDSELSSSFSSHTKAYSALSDKASMDEKASRLRRQITSDFYKLYTEIFQKSLSDKNLPMPVKMFLYFGYVDENLAGAQNAATLYSIAKQIGTGSSSGVYTFYDWLLAIYHGKKLPSRNEFDQDYSDYVHRQKLEGKLSPAKIRELETNPMHKVMFELENLFPTANKITYGRVTTFCPIFCKDDVLKDLRECYVNASQVGSILQKIKEVDYTAYYRESIDTKHFELMGREPVHMEYLPDVILMPNVGIRGSMWQEIEGKVRNSSSRMIISIFHMEDMESTFIHMTGELRWELCKRVQGGRWNDMTDPSLTSEYYDYAQFYKKNHELSSEAKERVRTSLLRAKNSFKEMFARDYMIWILYEGNGSPRLNKVARRILFTYCPFPQKINKALAQNPLYTELLERRSIKTAQKLHHLDMLEQKINKSGAAVPPSLENEKHYVSGE
ncbi:MAG: hypothetical protein LUG83_03690 [Lachnospiraceae bacterium]|nr:hypothetical protein [Lachnospiraceae bacterium]